MSLKSIKEDQNSSIQSSHIVKKSGPKIVEMVKWSPKLHTVPCDPENKYDPPNHRFRYQNGKMLKVSLHGDLRTAPEIVEPKEVFNPLMNGNGPRSPDVSSSYSEESVEKVIQDIENQFDNNKSRKSISSGSWNEEELIYKETLIYRH